MYSLEEITNKIFCGDAGAVLKEFPSESIDMCITSPPYFQQRHYNLGESEVGIERDYQAYLSELRAVFNQVHRVLKPRGTCWVNIGDKYKNGELYLIPHWFAIEMHAILGFKLFNEIIWHVPNTFTGSSKKRFTQDFEYLFAFAKQNDYHFEQQYEPYKTKYKSFEYDGKGQKDYKSEGAQDPSDAKRSILRSMSRGIGRHKRCVWSITHKSSKHTATFPRELVQTPILAGCPHGGIILDPFLGSGTAARVAMESGRKYTGIDLNPRSVESALKWVNEGC
jgi:DNA modification methylase